MWSIEGECPMHLLYNFGYSKQLNPQEISDLSSSNLSVDEKKECTAEN